MQYATKLFTAFLNVRNQLILKKKDIARKDCFSCKKSADQIIASRHEENWGGLNKNTEKNSKALYFDNEFLFNKKLSKIPVLKNGNCFHLAPIEIGNKRKVLSVSSELLKMNNFETIFEEEVKHQPSKCSEKNCDGVVKSTITKTGNHL